MIGESMSSNEGDEDDDESESGETSDAGLHEVSLSLDAVLYVLADQHRRDLLRYLVESPGDTCSFDECVSHLVRREAERGDERPASDQVEAMLHHVHIPKLIDTGVLEYDARSQEVRYRGHDRLELWLDRIHAGREASD